MTICVTYKCDGCFVESESVSLPHRQFHGLSGKSYGFGYYEQPDISESAPEGWIAYDWYTGCCYCPKCWVEIAPHSDKVGIS